MFLGCPMQGLDGKILQLLDGHVDAIGFDDGLCS